MLTSITLGSRGSEMGELAKMFRLGICTETGGGMRDVAVAKGSRETC